MGMLVLYNLSRRGARVDEWNGLENRRGVKATAGSNPAPSAIAFVRTHFVNSGVNGEVQHDILEPTLFH